MDKPMEDRERLRKIIRNSTLWDSCVLEAYEGDVDDLIENILFAGFRRASLPVMGVEERKIGGLE